MSDIDTAVVDSLKVLDLKRPIREADVPKSTRRADSVEKVGRSSRPNFLSVTGAILNKNAEDLIAPLDAMWITLSAIAGPASRFQISLRFDLILLRLYLGRFQRPEATFFPFSFPEAMR